MQNLRISISGPAHPGEECLLTELQDSVLPLPLLLQLSQKISQMLGDTIVPAQDAWFAPELSSCSADTGKRDGNARGMTCFLSLTPGNRG